MQMANHCKASRKRKQAYESGNTGVEAEYIHRPRPLYYGTKPTRSSVPLTRLTRPLGRLPDVELASSDELAEDRSTGNERGFEPFEKTEIVEQLLCYLVFRGYCRNSL